MRFCYAGIHVSNKFAALKTLTEGHFRTTLPDVSMHVPEFSRDNQIALWQSKNETLVRTVSSSIPSCCHTGGNTEVLVEPLENPLRNLEMPKALQDVAEEV